MKTLKTHVNSFIFSHLMIHLYCIGIANTGPVFIWYGITTRTRSIVQYHPPNPRSASFFPLHGPQLGSTLSGRRWRKLPSPFLDLGKDKRSLSTAKHYRVTDNAPPNPHPPTRQSSKLSSGCNRSHMWLSVQILSHVFFFVFFFREAHKRGGACVTHGGIGPHSSRTTCFKGWGSGRWERRGSCSVHGTC